MFRAQPQAKAEDMIEPKVFFSILCVSLLLISSISMHKLGSKESPDSPSPSVAKIMLTILNSVTLSVLLSALLSTVEAIIRGVSFRRLNSDSRNSCLGSSTNVSVSIGRYLGNKFFGKGYAPGFAPTTVTLFPYPTIPPQVFSEETAKSVIKTTNLLYKLLASAEEKESISYVEKRFGIK